MNDWAKTGAFLGGAALLWLLASLTGPRAIQNELFSDEGELFFPDFTDPTAASELEVWEFREASSDVVPFDVKKNDKGVWTIPSHYDYPADAKTRMAKAAALLVGLRKDAVVSDRKDDHARFGVVDPKDENLDLKGRGVRVAFKDKAGTVLGELIVGNEVEGKQGVRYVRMPDRKRVYKAKIDETVSTKFADWIETDLLKAQSWDVTKVVFDNYSVDEQRGVIVEGDKIVAGKDDASKWTLEGLKDDEQPNEDKLREVGDTLGQIKIVGVRPKPEGLTAALQQASGFDRLALMQHLQQRGYFLLKDGRLVSNEGDLIFTTRKGIRYTLRFGEIVYGEGDAVTAGKEEPKPKQPPDGKQGPQPLPGNNRYLMVTAEFDESLLKKPAGPRIAKDLLEQRKQARTAIEEIVKAVDAFRQQHDGKLPESLAKLTEAPQAGEAPPLKELKKDPWGQDYVLQPRGDKGDKFAVLSYGPDKKPGGEAGDADIDSEQLAAEDRLAQSANEWTEYDKKVEDGRKEGVDLARRFGPWYYVIDAALFQKLKPQRKDLVKPKEPPKDKPAAADARAGTGTAEKAAGK